MLRDVPVLPLETLPERELAALESEIGSVHADLLRGILRRLDRLEQANMTTSSASTSGTPAPELYVWCHVNLEAIPRLIQEAITVYSKSMPSMLDELEATWVDSSTLQLTLRWPTQSGENKAGDHGLASPDSKRWDLDPADRERLIR